MDKLIKQRQCQGHIATMSRRNFLTALGVGALTFGFAAAGMRELAFPEKAFAASVPETKLVDINDAFDESSGLRLKKAWFAWAHNNNARKIYIYDTANFAVMAGEDLCASPDNPDYYAGDVCIVYKGDNYNLNGSSSSPAVKTFNQPFRIVYENTFSDADGNFLDLVIDMWKVQFSAYRSTSLYTDDIPRPDPSIPGSTSTKVSYGRLLMRVGAHVPYLDSYEAAAPGSVYSSGTTPLSYLARDGNGKLIAHYYYMDMYLVPGGTAKRDTTAAQLKNSTVNGDWVVVFIDLDRPDKTTNGWTGGDSGGYNEEYYDQWGAEAMFVYGDTASKAFVQNDTTLKKSSYIDAFNCDTGYRGTQPTEGLTEEYQGSVGYKSANNEAKLYLLWAGTECSTYLSVGGVPTTLVPPPEGSFTLKATKKLKNGTLAANQFTFQLLDDKNNVLQTKKNAADGSVTFDPIAYDQTDIGTEVLYKIKEVAGNDATIEYDPHTCNAYVKTALDPNDNTKLKFTINYKTSNTFNNEVKWIYPEVTPTKSRVTPKIYQ